MLTSKLFCCFYFCCLYLTVAYFLMWQIFCLIACSYWAKQPVRLNDTDLNPRLVRGQVHGQNSGQAIIIIIINFHLNHNRDRQVFSCSCLHASPRLIPHNVYLPPKFQVSDMDTFPMIAQLPRWLITNSSNLYLFQTPEGFLQCLEVLAKCMNIYLLKFIQYQCF